MPATLFFDYHISGYRRLTTDGHRYFYGYCIRGEVGISMAVFLFNTSLY
jgi:hypothetical protein